MKKLLLLAAVLSLSTACASTTQVTTGASQPPSASPSPSPSESQPPVSMDDEPSITITEPTDGATVERTFRLAGMALVFEANVVIRVHDTSGTLVLEDFATAEDGTTFSPWEIELTIPDEVSGTLVVSAVEIDARDGSDAFVASITVAIA